MATPTHSQDLVRAVQPIDAFDRKMLTVPEMDPSQGQTSTEVCILQVSKNWRRERPATASDQNMEAGIAWERGYTFYTGCNKKREMI